MALSIDSTFRFVSSFMVLRVGDEQADKGRLLNQNLADKLHLLCQDRVKEGLGSDSVSSGSNVAKKLYPIYRSNPQKDTDRPGIDVRFLGPDHQDKVSSLYSF
jgi:hypothetical protein